MQGLTKATEHRGFLFSFKAGAYCIKNEINPVILSSLQIVNIIIKSLIPPDSLL